MPADGIAAADRSVIFKEVVREIARRCAMRASFAPLAKPDGPGNGAHVHFSLVDSAGASMLYDPAADTRPPSPGSARSRCASRRGYSLTPMR